MNIFITKKFDKLLKSENLNRHELESVIDDILKNRSISLGAKLFKVRMKAMRRGKSGGYRVIVFLKVREHMIFLVVFAKSDRENITGSELKALKLYSKELDCLSHNEIELMVENGSLIKLHFHEERKSDENQP
jgi:hypothetical protein